MAKAKGQQRGRNQTFPYSDAKRKAIHDSLKPGQRMHATITKYGKPLYARATITRVARTGWIYVKIDGRKSPTKVDPTKWTAGEGHAPAEVATTPKKKATVTKLRKPKAKPAATKAAAPRARKKAAIAGGAGPAPSPEPGDAELA